MGNDFEKGNPIEYPAAYPGLIAVGATDEMDRRGDFSNTGEHIALVAPGVNILSTTPRYPSQFATKLRYEAWPGTSMATPHVAAAAALLLAKKPGLTPAEVKKRLTATADRVPEQAKRPDDAHGWGRLNVAAALS
jgi:subtilisin family serine protease